MIGLMDILEGDSLIEWKKMTCWHFCWRQLYSRRTVQDFSADVFQAITITIIQFGTNGNSTPICRHNNGRARAASPSMSYSI
jgi:hypothetical protein